MPISLFVTLNAYLGVQYFITVLTNHLFQVTTNHVTGLDSIKQSNTLQP